MTNGTSVREILEATKTRLNKRTKFTKKERLYSQILLGEFIRQSFHGRWILLKQYGTYNPFFSPAIIKPDNRIVALFDVSQLYFDPGEFSLENFIKYPSVQNPLLVLNDGYFRARFDGSEIVE